jgi:hypothetical protein
MLFRFHVSACHSTVWSNEAGSAWIDWDSDVGFHLWLYSPCGPWPLFQFLNLFTVGRTPWTVVQPVSRPLHIHRTTQTQNKHTQTSIPRVRFEATIPTFKRAKTVHALDLRPLWSQRLVSTAWKSWSCTLFFLNFSLNSSSVWHFLSKSPLYYSIYMSTLKTTRKCFMYPFNCPYDQVPELRNRFGRKSLWKANIKSIQPSLFGLAMSLTTILQSRQEILSSLANKETLYNSNNVWVLSHICFLFILSPPPTLSVAIFRCISRSIHQADNCLSCYAFIKFTWHVSHSISMEQSVTKIWEVQHYG